MNWRTRTILTISIFSTQCAGTSNAGLVLSMVPQGSTTVNVGDSIDVDITLTQNGLGSGDAANALTPGFGLTIFGFSLTSGPAFTPSAAGPSSSLPATWIVTANATDISAFELAFPPAIPMPLEAPVGTPVTLTTFTLTATSEGDSTLAIADHPTLLGENFAFNDIDIGSSVNESLILGSVAPLSITAVPEPNAFLLLGLVGSVCGLKAYVKRRKQVFVDRS